MIESTLDLKPGEHFDETDGKLTFDGVYAIVVDVTAEYLEKNERDIKKDDLFHDHLGAESADQLVMSIQIHDNVVEFLRRSFFNTLQASKDKHYQDGYGASNQFCLKISEETVIRNEDTVKGAATKIFDFLKRIELAKEVAR